MLVLGSQRAGLLLAFTSFMLFVLPAHSALIALDDPVFGLGAVPRDTDNGVEWLALELARDRTFADVSGQFSPLGDFAGWRHANRAELATLFVAGGFALPHSASPSTAAFAAFQQLLGVPIVAAGDSYLVGLYDDTADGVAADVGVANLTIEALVESTVALPDAFPVDLSDGGLGHWLIRPVAVPEPAALGLICSALLLFGVLRGRRGGAR